MPSDGFHYHVLRVSHDNQHEVCSQLQARLPEEHGKAFLPLMEYYRRDRKCIETKLMFLGYIFVRTDLSRSELYDVCKALAKPVRARLLDDISSLWDKETDSICDLTAEEESFFDTILDEVGIERMSRGYLDDDDRAVVMEGPLKYFADRIVKLDKRNWLAWLDMKIEGQLVKAGLHICHQDTWAEREVATDT